MKLTKQGIEESLNQKRQQLARQQSRREQMDNTIQHTENDIEQLEYALHELEEIQKGQHERRIIPNDQITTFFTHISQVFDDLQRRWHRQLNYKMTCMVIYARYQFRSRVRDPERQYLSPATVLSYFKHEREVVG